MPEPTVIAAPSAAEARPVEVYDLTPEQRETWLKTGDRPAKPVKEASAPSEPVKKADSGPAKQDKTAEEKEAEKERNWKQLREKADKADRLEAENAELRKAGGKKDEKAADTAAPAEKPQAPVKPKRADFASDDEYEKAYEGEYLPKKQAFDAATAAYDKQQAEITERQKGLLGSWKGIADKGKELLGEGDWKKVTDTYSGFQIFAGDPFEVHLRGSEPEIAARFMQYMSLKPADVKRIIALPIREQFKELDALETALRSELKGKDGDAAPSKSEEKPPKKEKEITAAGKPPSEPGGQAATSEDEADAALKRGDGESYRRIMNERDLAKRRARRKGR